MDKISISAVIICLNEQTNIERCLKSLKWVDEVVVYDSGSTDETIDIARQMGARVVEGKWLGFGPTKNLATSLAKNNWILSLDADEEVPDRLRDELIEVFHSLEISKAYSVPRLSYFMNRWVKHGGWYPDFQLRLFNKTYYQWNLQPIHEKIEAQNQMGLASEKLKNHINHYVFKSIEHQIQTNNRYSSLQAKKMFDEKKKFSYFHLFTKPYVKFVECYVFKLGFLDGWAGYVIARNAAYSVFMKWIKLKELYD